MLRTGADPLACRSNGMDSVTLDDAHCGHPSKVETAKRVIIPLETESKLKSLFSQMRFSTNGKSKSEFLNFTKYPLKNKKMQLRNNLTKIFSLLALGFCVF